MNKVMKKVKRNSVTKAIIIGILYIILGMILGTVLCMDVIKFYTVKEDIFSHTVEELEDRTWYACQNNLLLDYYASDSDGYYFATPINSNDEEVAYMGFFVPSKDYELANKIVDETYAYFADEGNVPEDYISGVGLFREMDYKEQTYFRDYFVQSNADLEIISNLCYYTVEMTTQNSLWGVEEFVGILLLVASIGLGIFLIVKALIGGNMKKFKTVMNQNNISMQDIERDMEMATKIGKCYIGRKYIVIAELHPRLIVADKLVWVYPHVQRTVHKINYVLPIAVTKTYSVVCINQANICEQVNLRSEKQVQQVIEVLMKVAPYVIFGHSDEIANLYRTDFAGMCQYVADKKIA